MRKINSYSVLKLVVHVITSEVQGLVPKTYMRYIRVDVNYFILTQFRPMNTFCKHFNTVLEFCSINKIHIAPYNRSW
jgi:hypothetical protein